MNDPFFNEACDSVDCAVFSGDHLADDKDRAEFKEYCESWLRQIAAWEEINAELKAEENDPVSTE